MEGVNLNLNNVFKYNGGLFTLPLSDFIPSRYVCYLTEICMKYAKVMPTMILGHDKIGVRFLKHDLNNSKGSSK